MVADGGWGTQLALRGLGSEAPETWNLTHPQEVAEVAAEYVAAGAQIILTNTFGGTALKLARAHVADPERVNVRGAELSRQAAGDRALVFGSVGPTGELLGLTSTLTEAQVEEGFAAQAAGLARGGVQGLAPDGVRGFVVETFADLTEALCALRGIRRACGLPVVVSMTFDEGVRGPATMMGVTPERAARELTEAGADLVGANCGGLGSAAWREVVAAFSGATHLPVWVKPNAGLPQLVGGKSVFPMPPEEFAELGVSLAQAGAKVIGGCCGTTPAHISALVAALSIP